MKRILLILLIIVLVGIGLYFGRSYIFKFKEPITEEGPTEPEVTVDPNEELESPDGLTVVADISAFDYWIDSSDRSIYVIDTAGALYRTPAGGESEKIYSLGTPDVVSVLPAPKGTLAVVQTGSRQNPFFAIVNPLTRTRQFLPVGTLAAAWSPDGKEIVILKNPLSLHIFTVATSKSRFVTNLNTTDILLSWKKPREIYIGSRPAAGIAGSWWSYGLDKKTFTLLIEELPGLSVTWSSDGLRGLTLSNETTSRRSSLYMTDVDTDIKTNLELITLPDKCTLADTVIYCGEPLAIETDMLPDSYYQNSYTVDNILRIELVPNLKNTVVYQGNLELIKLDVYHPIKVGSSLYFINRYDKKIYSLAL